MSEDTTNTAKKLTQRAAGLVQTSIVLPEQMLKLITQISVQNYRSRNSQIIMMLQKQLDLEKARTEQAFEITKKEIMLAAEKSPEWGGHKKEG